MKIHKREIYTNTGKRDIQGITRETYIPNGLWPDTFITTLPSTREKFDYAESEELSESV